MLPRCAALVAHHSASKPLPSAPLPRARCATHVATAALASYSSLAPKNLPKLPHPPITASNLHLAASHSPKRLYSTAPTGEQEGGDEKNKMTTEVTPWLKFDHRPYVPLRPKLRQRLRRWWLSRHLLKPLGMNEDDLLKGAQQAFTRIIPYTPQYGEPIDKEALSPMMDPPLLRQFWQMGKRKAQLGGDGIQLGLVEILEAEIIDIVLGRLATKRHGFLPPTLTPLSLQHVRLTYLSSDKPADRDSTPFTLGVAVRIHTKEEVKKVGGVEQLSPTRFFEMDHLWVFGRNLPPPSEIRLLRQEGEQMPEEPWRLISILSDYRRALSSIRPPRSPAASSSS